MAERKHDPDAYEPERSPTSGAVRFFLLVLCVIAFRLIAGALISLFD